MGRKKVGDPISVALTDTQRQWIADQGMPVSEAVRKALDAMIQDGPVWHLKELIGQVETEIIRLERQGHPTVKLTMALENLWRLVLES